LRRETANLPQKSDVPFSKRIWQYLVIIGTQLCEPLETAVFLFGKTMALINLALDSADKTLLLHAAEKDIQFVAAKSLTQTVQAVQESVRRHIREAFVLRRQNFPNSMKIRPATKQTLEAKVFTMAGFAALQQTGGRQTAKSGRLAVPLYGSLREVKPTARPTRKARF
jgi:hypothetical protein